MVNLVKAVIMAGGEGTRLRPLTYTRPKPFVPIGGRPVIEYVVDSLRRAGVTDILLTTCYKPEVLLGHLGGGSRFGANLVYSLEDTAMGTAGGVKKVRSYLNETFFVASGDGFARVDLKSLLDFHKKSGAVATMGLTRVDNPSEFGIVGMDENGRINRFKEKPKTREEAFSNLINTGIYVLEPEVLDHVPEGEPFDFGKQLFPLLVEKGLPVFGRELEGLWIDVGRPSDLLLASERLCEESHGGNIIAEDAQVAGDARLSAATLHSGVRVGAGAKLTRVILMEGAEVGPDAVLQDTILGVGAKVGARARVTGSVLGDGAIVGEEATLDGQKVDPAGNVDRGLTVKGR